MADVSDEAANVAARPVDDASLQPPTEPAGRGVHDPARRAFFFQFGRQAVSAVGQVAGMADIVGRASSTAAAGLLGLDQPATAEPAAGLRRSARSGASPVVSRADVANADDVFRSPYRLSGDELVLLDQRVLPEEVAEVSARRGSDVAYYMRIGVVRGGPVMAQAAAYGLALTARERMDQPLESRQVELRRTRRALAGARPSARLPAWAMERMEAREAAIGDEADGAAVASALLDEADAIAVAFGAQHTRIVEHLVERLPRPEGRPLSVLLHGDSGGLSGGMVGTGITALQVLIGQDREVRVHVTETRPFMEGARLAGWQLRQAGIAHRILPDAAVAWLLMREPVDVVIIAGECLAMNGDCAAVIGSRAVAQQVAAADETEARPRPQLLVAAVSATIDPAIADGAAIAVELRPARDLTAYLSDVPVRSSDALVPASDVIPHELIDALVTEHGICSPVGPDGIADLAAVAGLSRDSGAGATESPPAEPVPGDAAD